MHYLRLDRMPGESPPEFAAVPAFEHVVRRRKSISGHRFGAVALALTLTTAALLSAAGNHTAVAASGGSYVLDPSVIAGGGATLSGGSFRLSGTVGQTATATLSASGFILHDGFWTGQAPTTDTIFVNGFEL